MLVVPNGFAAGEVVLAEPNSPLAGADAAEFVCPKRPPEPPLVVVLPKENVLLGFAGSDMLFGNGAVPLGLRDLSAVDLRRGILGLGRDMSSCSQMDLPPEKERRGGGEESEIMLQVGNPVVVASLIRISLNTSNAKWC